MVQQAREWESSGEYARAVECYMKITTSLTSDQGVMEKCWMKVGQNAVVFIHRWDFCLGWCVSVSVTVSLSLSPSLSLSLPSQ